MFKVCFFDSDRNKMTDTEHTVDAAKNRVDHFVNSGRCSIDGAVFGGGRCIYRAWKSDKGEFFAREF